MLINKLKHYENMALSYTDVSEDVKNENHCCNILAQNIDSQCTLESHHRGGSKEHPSSMFRSETGKKCLPLHTPNKWRTFVFSTWTGLREMKMCP